MIKVKCVLPHTRLLAFKANLTSCGVFAMNPEVRSLSFFLFAGRLAALWQSQYYE
jgi:hypothetical protein